MKKYFVFLSLFSSGTALLCCALPFLLVNIGLGAAFASLTAAVPQIHWITNYKLFIFILTGLLLAVSFFLIYRPDQPAECPIDQEKPCGSAKNYTRIVLYIASALYLASLIFSYVLPYILSL